MISFEEAIELLKTNVVHTQVEKLPLIKAGNRILVNDFKVPYDHPFFDQTAMDGYAIKIADIEKPLNITGEVRAGTTSNSPLKSGEAFRIFTGGTIPNGADTVIMQEHTQRNGDQVSVLNHEYKIGAHIRYQGEQVKKGETGLKVGTQLNEGAIGFMAGFGIKEVAVSGLPTIGLIITGNEFAQTASELEPGKIFESNGQMLQAALAVKGIDAKPIIGIDDPDTLNNLFSITIDQNDLTLITGGVSVGDYDFTRKILEDLGFTIIFHNVAQKPGKPILFAMKNGKTVFGLPGNPRSVIMSFYEMVWPYILMMMKSNNPLPRKTRLPLSHNFERRPGRTEFMAGKLNKDGVEIAKSQRSHMLQSLIDADVIIKIPAATATLNAGSMVEIHLFP